MSIKISQLTASSAITSDDLFVVVNDPSGSPQTQKTTAATVLSYITGTVFNTFKASTVTVTGNSIFSGSIFVSGNLTGSGHAKFNEISGTTAQFTVISASVISASSYIGPISGGTGLIGETTRTINLSSSMTVSQIQTEIDNIKKYIPSGEIVTVQFADGTYTITGALNFKGFFGGGELKIVGNLTETTASHSNQAVILDATSTQDIDLLKIENCKLNTTVDRMQFKINSGSNPASSCIRSIQSDYVNVKASYFSGSAGPPWSTYPATYGIRLDASRAILIENTCTGLEHFISAYETSNVLSVNNTTIGNIPFIGLNSVSAVIYRSGTQPSGFGASTNTGDGGQIL